MSDQSSLYCWLKPATTQTCRVLRGIENSEAESSEQTACIALGGLHPAILGNRKLGSRAYSILVDGCGAKKVWRHCSLWQRPRLNGWFHVSIEGHC
eukprot:2175610-Amphidinium_carterae.1